MKTCTRCKLDVPKINFYKNKNLKDRLCTWCKNCQKEYQQQKSKSPKTYLLYTRICSACKLDLPLLNFYKNSSSNDGLMKRCKSCCDQWRLNNPDRALKSVIKYHAKNKESISIQRKEYRQKNLEIFKDKDREKYKLNREENLKVRAEYQKRYPDRCNAVQAKRRATKLNATPNWANPKAIQLIYKQAKDLEKQTGLKYHVDHVVPLVSDKVCGLHCEANLQILTAQENLSKSNSIWPDMA